MGATTICYCKESRNRMTSDTRVKAERNKNNINVNIIYLIDFTYSMKKHSKIIQNINSINKSLKEIYKNIIFGYVLYRDYSDDKIEHIKIIQSDASNFNIPNNSFSFEKNMCLYFIGGGDYAEDWANPLNEISKLDLEYNYENIIIHLCDAGAHGNRFSDYCQKNDEEKKLIDALKQCNTKRIKIICLLFNEFSRKSFMECQNIYLEQGGYYNIVDLTRKNLETLDWNQLIKKYIEKALKKELNINRDYYNKIEGFENEFDYIIDKQVNIKNIKMLNLNYIKHKYFKNYKKIQFLPDLNIRQIKKLLAQNYSPYLNETENKLKEKSNFKDAIKQGQIGDCYLISAIISILYGNVPLIRYIFPYYYNTEENTDLIYMNIFESGYRKIICFNNTYPIQVKGLNYDLCFAKPLNNSFSIISIEKGYAVFKSDNQTIKSGFIKMWGGRMENVFRDLFGTNSEVIFEKEKIHYNLIKDKIKKYIDYRGFVTFSVFFNIDKGGHAFSVIGYKENINTKEFIVEILNPWHCGDYLRNNIKKQKDYDELKNIENKKLFDEEKSGKNIDEKEFNEPELKKSFDNYKKNGYLLMKIDTFYKWIYDIEFTDPMIGCQEYIIEICPGEKKNIDFVVKNKSKFKAFIIYKSEKMNEDEYNKEFNEKVYYSNNKYKLILKNNNNKYENNEENNALIYEILNTGNYSLEIINKNLFEKEEDYLYIKIQTSPFIDITNNDINIKNLDFSKANKLDLTNGGMELKNCSCFNLSIKNNNYSPKTPCACYLLEKYLLIDEILYYIIKICNYFSNNKEYDFTDILPMNDSIYKYYSSEYIKNPHLYYHYIETLKGFIVIIINKSKFNWNCDSIIEYSIEQNEYTTHFNFGSFKISYDLKLYDFDYRFKNILTQINYLDSYLYLRQSTTIIEKLKSESNKNNINVPIFLKNSKIYGLENIINKTKAKVTNNLKDKNKEKNLNFPKYYMRDNQRCVDWKTWMKDLRCPYCCKQPNIANHFIHDIQNMGGGDPDKVNWNGCDQLDFIYNYYRCEKCNNDFCVHNDYIHNIK